MQKWLVNTAVKLVQSTVIAVGTTIATQKIIDGIEDISKKRRKHMARTGS